MTALHYACKYGHHDVVQLLIESKADVSMLDFVSSDIFFVYLSATSTMIILSAIMHVILCVLIQYWRAWRNIFHVYFKVLMIQKSSVITFANIWDSQREKGPEHIIKN